MNIFQVCRMYTSFASCSLIHHTSVFRCLPCCFSCQMCLLMFVTLSACASVILFDHFTALWLHNLTADLINVYSILSQIFPFNVNCLWPLLLFLSARSTVIVWPMSHTLSSNFHCNGPVSSAIWLPYPWLLCRSYARAGWPSVTLASWRVEPRNTGLSSLPRACPGSRMMRWGIHTHNHAWNKLMNPSHVIWAIL